MVYTDSNICMVQRRSHLLQIVKTDFLGNVCRLRCLATWYISTIVQIFSFICLHQDFIINAYRMNWRLFPGAGRILSINAVFVRYISQHSFLPGALPGHFLTFSTALPCSLDLTARKQVHLSDFTLQIPRCGNPGCGNSWLLVHVAQENKRLDRMLATISHWRRNRS